MQLEIFLMQCNDNPKEILAIFNKLQLSKKTMNLGGWIHVYVNVLSLLC